MAATVDVGPGSVAAGGVIAATAAAGARPGAAENSGKLDGS